jgi:uncharacterized protein
VNTTQQNTSKTIIIAGGSGLIGRRLREHLVSQGHIVKILSRTSHHSEPGSIVWDPMKSVLDQSVVEEADVIINLAGESIAQKRWTPWRRRKIINSRIFTTNLIAETLEKSNHSVQVVINASAIGYYGDTGDMVLYEDHKPASDFLGKTCEQWENAAHRFERQGIRTVIFRIGVVLARESGMLAEILKTVPFGVLPYFGNGKQYQSWIHLDDLCRMIVKAIDDNQLSGTYNAVSPGPLSNRNFMLLLAQIIPGRQLLIRIPKIFLQLFLGDMSKVILHSSRVSSKKIEATGFTFKFPQANQAIRNLLGK